MRYKSMMVKPFDPTDAQVNIINFFAESGNPKRLRLIQSPNLSDSSPLRIPLLPERAQVRA